MSSENINIQAEIDSAKSTGEILLAYAKAAVVADMFKSGAESKDAERSEK